MAEKESDVFNGVISTFKQTYTVLTRTACSLWGYVSGFAPSLSSAPGSPDLTGVWLCNDEGRYYIRQIGNEVWWYSEPSFQPSWANAAYGRIIGDELELKWVDLPKGYFLNQGTLILKVVSPQKMVQKNETGGFGGSVWTREK